MTARGGKLVRRNELREQLSGFQAKLKVYVDFAAPRRSTKPFSERRARGRTRPSNGSTRDEKEGRERRRRGQTSGSDINGGPKYASVWDIDLADTRRQRMIISYKDNIAPRW